MKKLFIFIMGIALLSTFVLSADVIRFSGALGNGSQLNGTVISCGNGICSSWETNLNCPLDCPLAITPYLNITLISYDLSGMANDQYSDGWNFVFYVDFFSPGAKYLEFAIQNWNDGLGHSIQTDGNTKMEYPTTTGLIGTYYVQKIFQEPASAFVSELADSDLSKPGTQATVTIYVKLPTDTYPGQFTTSYEAGIW